MNETPMKMSADQHLAMAQLLRRKSRVRARSFLALARRARDEDWPSSASAPFAILTEEESKAAWSDPPTRQRVFVRYLTATELEALRRDAEAGAAFAQAAFAHLRPVE